MADLEFDKKSIADLVPPGMIHINLRTQTAENKLKAFSVVKYDGHFFRLQGSPIDKSDKVGFRKIYIAYLKTDFDQKSCYLPLNTLDLYS